MIYFWLLLIFLQTNFLPYHIGDLRRIRHTFDFTSAATIATSLVHSRLEYCNSLYHGLPLTQIKRPQEIENSLARAVTRTPKHSHITPALKSLHCLKFEQRIQFKIISITHNLLHSSEPQYLRKLIIIKPSGKTRSSEYLCLSVPPLTSKLKFSNRSFRISAPNRWNFLPSYIRTYAPVIGEAITNITNITSSSVSPTF